MRTCVAALILCTLPSRVAVPGDRDSTQDSGLRSVQATFLALDTAQSQVTYLVPAGDIRTSTVSSPRAMERLARMRSGQTVLLKYRAHGPAGEWIVEEAQEKKKANWWKRGVILFLVVAIVAGVLSLGSSDCGAYCG